MLRYAYNTNGFAHHRLDDAIEIIRECGYDGVGLTLDVHHLDPFRATAAEIARVRRRLRGLEVVIQTGARFLLDPRRKHEPTLISNEPEGRKRRLAFLRKAIDVGESLGASAVSFWSGKAPAGAKDAELFGRLVDACGRLCRDAERAGLRLAFEPEPGMWVERLEDYRRLRDAVKSKAFGLALDVGHLAVSGEPLESALRDFGDEISVVEIEDIRGRVHEHRMFGEGDLDFAAVLRAFREIGYRGTLEVELSRDSHRAPECCAESIRYLRAHELGSERRTSPKRAH